MVGKDKTQLFSKLHELHVQHGKGWNEIADILKEEGYEENGKALTGNALRKRYARWSSTQQGKSDLTSELKSKQEHRGVDFDWLQKGSMETD